MVENVGIFDKFRSSIVPLFCQKNEENTDSMSKWIIIEQIYI